MSVYTTEIIKNFIVTITYDVNEHSGKLIPTISSVVHNGVDITEIVDRDILYNIRSTIFNEINLG